jgi:predicted RNA-binding protein with RPS1 domain
MVHVSNLGLGFVKDLTTVMKLGTKLKVKYTGKDEKGRIKFVGANNSEHTEAVNEQSH